VVRVEGVSLVVGLALSFLQTKRPLLPNMGGAIKIKSKTAKDFG
jgi:hypothetical protein